MNHYGVAREAAAIYDVPLKGAVGLRASGFGRFWSALPDHG